MELTPDRPSTMASPNSRRPIPFGETTPMPVITTRCMVLHPSMVACPQAAVGETHDPVAQAPSLPSRRGLTRSILQDRRSTASREPHLTLRREHRTREPLSFPKDRPAAPRT